MGGRFRPRAARRSPRLQRIVSAAAPVAGEAASDPGGSPGSDRWGVPGSKDHPIPQPASATDRDSLLFQGQVLFARNCSVGVLPRQGGGAPAGGPRLRGQEAARRLPDPGDQGRHPQLDHGQLGGTGCPTMRSPPSSRSYRFWRISNLGAPDPVFGGGRFSAANVRRVGKSNRTSAGSAPRLPASTETPAGAVPCSSTPATTTAAPTATRSAAGGSEAAPDLGLLASAPPRMLLREILTPDAFAIPGGPCHRAGDGRPETRSRYSASGRPATRVKLFDVTRFPPVTRNIRKDRILSEKPTSSAPPCRIPTPAATPCSSSSTSSPSSRQVQGGRRWPSRSCFSALCQGRDEAVPNEPP